MHGSKIRQTINDGKVMSEPIAEYSARYWFKVGDSDRTIGSHFSRSSHQVVDRQTGEVLGELAVMSIYPSLLDNVAIALSGMGSGFSPWTCGDEPSHRLSMFDLIFATIQPAGQNKGEQK
jgi:hypothetical protein